ncbi:MAG: ATP-dependent DNA helicase RecG [Bacteroidetes bacterium]|nr:MAG: ATP-dependent DNA helicase RecG [Bacteroidota bacterium]
MQNILDTSIEYLKGVGPKRAAMLKKEIGVLTFDDLLQYYPFRYIDKSKIHSVSEIRSDMAYVQLKGSISNVKKLGKPRSQRLSAILNDDTGSIELVWFKGIKWLEGKFKPGVEYIVFGKPSLFNNKYNIAHPEVELPDEDNLSLSQVLVGHYSETETLRTRGLSSRNISKLMKTLLLKVEGSITETLSPDILDKLGLLSREEAFQNIHFPKNQELLRKAEARLKFEELFFIQLRLLKQKKGRQQEVKGHAFKYVGDFTNEFYKQHLSFELTNAQKRVIREIRADMGSGIQMNRLLQGDVGSGKTLVALMSMLIALDNNYQACMMAPTEILASQHFATISEMTAPMGIRVELLTGSTRAAKRKQLHEDLRSGELQIIIGTHALLEEEVKFKNLGLVVIDEQHRFGVAQRARLYYKNIAPPHILVMTATPIPRTLAMTLYGDLDFSVIDELPPGRKPVKTVQFFDSKRLRLFGFMKEQIALGRQVYVVYPLINESEKLDLKDLMDGYESISRAFPLPEYPISIVHGKLKQDVKEYEMQRFIKGETKIMVATTVIEVGVDIPNASVMVIENAERFGLSQLHQLRGRVGRSADQSYCILMSGYKLSKEARTRLKTMTETTDGFMIAETDLKLRGPGDMAGTQQSGIVDLRIANLLRDEKILKYARNLAQDILDDDPVLSKAKNKLLRQTLASLNKYRPDWGSIS